MSMHVRMCKRFLVVAPIYRAGNEAMTAAQSGQPWMALGRADWPSRAPALEAAGPGGLWRQEDPQELGGEPRQAPSSLWPSARCQAGCMMQVWLTSHGSAGQRRQGGM